MPTYLQLEREIVALKKRIDELEDENASIKQGLEDWRELGALLKRMLSA